MNFVRNLWQKAKKGIFVTTALVAVAAAGVFAYGSYSETSAAGCPTNDIMPCGATSAANFIKKLKANNPSDMDNIYADARYDLPKSQYDEFAKYAKKGKINPDTGNITVDGVTVMQDAQSIGRNAKSVSHPIKIDGKTYHESPIRLLTEYTNDAMVLFDEKGNVQTVIMNLCGNPMTGKEKNPKYNCDGLKMTKVDNDTYTFSSNISASNGAKVSKVVYDFGDGQTKTETNPSTVIEHTYAKPGNYTAKVTAYVKTTFGRSEFPITVTGECQKQISVEAPKTPHINIEKFVNDKKHDQVAVNQNYNYTIKVTNDGQVDLTNAVVTDTPKADSNIQLVSSNGVGTINGNTWTYTVPSLKVGESKSFTLTAKVTAYVSGSLQNDVCVDAPQVPGNPDDCDSATVEVPKPAATCVGLQVEYITRTDVKLTGSASAENGATISGYVFTIKNASGTVVKTMPVTSSQLSAASDTITLEPGDYTASLVVKTSLGDKTNDTACQKPIKIAKPEMVTVCNPASGQIIEVPKSEEGNYKPVGDKACEKDVQVCNPATGQIITVKESEAGNYKPVGDKACQKDVQVCDPATGTIITVKESEADNYKPVGDKACEKSVKVCNPTTGEIITVKESDAGNYKPENDSACVETPETPEVIPSTGPASIIAQIIGATTLAGTTTAYIRSRRA